MKVGIFFITSIVTLLILPSLANAAIPISGGLSHIVDTFHAASAGWGTVIKGYAFRLFWLLVAIDFSWGAIKLALEKSEFESFWAFIINRVMTIGFFLALITFSTGAGAWQLTIIDSFRSLASIAGGVSKLDPSSVLDQGIFVSVTIIEKTNSILSPASAILGGLMGLIIIGIYALIAAELVFVLVSMWLILYAGIIMLAFGGSEWTRSYALNYYKTILAIGAKLFILQLLIGLGTSIISGWAKNLSVGLLDPTFAEVFVIAGGVLVLYVLVKGIGSLVESLITGHGAASASGSSAIVAGAAVGAAAVGSMATGGAGAAQSALGASQAASAASTLASMKSEESGPSGVAQSIASLGDAVGGETGRSMGESIGGAFDRVAGTVKEAAGAYGQDYAARVSGDFSAQHGTTGGRMANIMADKIAESELGGGSSSEAGNYVSGVGEGIVDNALTEKDD